MQDADGQEKKTDGKEGGEKKYKTNIRLRWREKKK